MMMACRIGFARMPGREPLCSEEGSGGEGELSSQSWYDMERRPVRVEACYEYTKPSQSVACRSITNLVEGPHLDYCL